MLHHVVMIQRRQPKILQIVAAAGAARRFACRLNGRQQQRDQNTDDCDHDQQFHQRETAPSCTGKSDGGTSYRFSLLIPIGQTPRLRHNQTPYRHLRKISPSAPANAKTIEAGSGTAAPLPRLLPAPGPPVPKWVRQVVYWVGPNRSAGRIIRQHMGRAGVLAPHGVVGGVYFAVAVVVARQTWRDARR